METRVSTLEATARMNRRLILFLTAFSALTLVSGALLFGYIFNVAHTNSGFICTFGSLINAAPIEQRAEQSNREFQRDVATAHEFVNRLNDLQDCDPPATIRIAPNSKASLHSP